MIRRLGERPLLGVTALLFVAGSIGSGFVDSVSLLV
jgi:hypothetical protein